ncbi:MAG: hypothetical protein JNJ61_14485 [Anaerolineae bacterium]|nr:hypothetical protein [Anaerolineae bacterium]
MQQPQTQSSGPPIHYLAAMLTVILDWLWGMPEIAGGATGVGIIALPFLMLSIGAVAFTGVTLIQRFMGSDGWGAALAKGVVMGVVAGVPFMVTGTAIGGVLLGWAGLGALRRMLGGGDEQPRQIPGQKR